MDKYTDEISDQLKEAIRYKVELGLSIVSAPRGDKFPVPWDKDYSTPPENLAPYFKKGDENIIAFTGQEHNLIAIDFDIVKDANSEYYGKFTPRVESIMAELLLLRDKPWVVKSPRGGKQYRYRPDPNHPIPQRNGVIEGLDTRTGKGVLPCPPSVFFNPKTKEYAHYINETDPFTSSFDVVPYEFLTNLVPEILEAEKTKTGEYKEGVVPEGCRDEWLTSMGGTLIRKTSLWKEVLTELNSSLCVPPLKKIDVDKIIKSISRYAEEVSSLNEFKDDVLEPLSYDLTELESLDLKEPRFLVDGLIKIPENGVSVVFGPTEQCKSYFLESLVIPWSKGENAFGCENITTVKSKILLANTEHPLGYQRKRFHYLGGKGNKNISVYNRVDRFKIEKEREVALLLGHLEKRAFDVLIVDLCSDVFSGDISNAKDVGKIFEFCRKVIALGKTIILVIHTRKGEIGANIIEAMSGSGDLGNKAAVGYLVKKTGNTSITVQCGKFRFSEKPLPVSLEMTRTEDEGGDSVITGFRYTGVAPAIDIYMIEREKAEKIITDAICDTKTLTHKMVHSLFRDPETLEYMGIDKEAVRKALQSLCKRGIIRHTNGGDGKGGIYTYIEP